MKTLISICFTFFLILSVSYVGAHYEFCAMNHKMEEEALRTFFEHVCASMGIYQKDSAYHGPWRLLNSQKSK